MAKADEKTHDDLIKIAIVGPESTGKTFLAKKLAAHYNCLWVPEYAREYLTKLKTSYTKEDVEKIARGQIKSEDAAAKNSKSLLICDTNLLVIKVWMEHKYGTVPEWVDKEIITRPYRLHLLTAPDVPYEDDPLRENPQMGEYFLEKYEKMLKKFGFTYIVISGNKRLRLNSAINAIDEITV